jgi:hypothetical protein
MRIENSPYSQLRKLNKVRSTPSSQRKTSKQGLLKPRNNIKRMNQKGKTYNMNKIVYLIPRQATISITCLIATYLSLPH